MASMTRALGVQCLVADLGGATLPNWQPSSSLAAGSRARGHQEMQAQLPGKWLQLPLLCS